MRVCPKCGFKDPLHWKQCAFRQHISYCKIGDLEFNNSLLANKVKKEIYCSEGFYAYHLTKGGRVERQAICENPTWKQRWYLAPYEKSKGNSLQGQHHQASILANKHIQERKLQTKLLEAK